MKGKSYQKRCSPSETVFAIQISVIKTIVIKGLEFDCVIIDTSDKLSVKDFYVAMTRAKKKILSYLQLMKSISRTSPVKNELSLQRNLTVVGFSY